MKTVKYWIKDYGQDIEDAYEIDVKTFDSDDLEWHAEQCAEDYHNNHDGWESDWPLTFSLADALGNFLGEVEVNRETEPVFYGRVKK